MTLANVVDRVQQLRSHLGLDRTTATATDGTGFASALSSARSTGLDASVAGTSGTSGSAVIDKARNYLGIRYVYGSNDPSKGLDCSGLVQRAYGDLGIKLPRVAADQARMGTKVDSLAQAKAGDLVAFGSPVDHIGIYLGDNKMIVAPHTGDVVKVQTVYKTPTAIRRIIPTPPPAAFPPRHSPRSGRPRCPVPAASRTPTSSGRPRRSTGSTPTCWPPSA